ERGRRASARIAQQLLDDLLDEAARREQAPGSRAAGLAGAIEHPPRPPHLALALQRRLDRRSDQSLGEPARAQIVGDPEAPRPAQAERASPVEGQPLVAHVPQLPPAGDRARGRLGLIARALEAVGQRRLRQRRACEQARRHVERRRIGPWRLPGLLRAAPGPQSRALRALRPTSPPCATSTRWAPLPSEAGPAGASDRRPNFSRTRASMAAATGACSRRKSRAFSRP